MESLLLAIDAGNTNVVMGLYDGERLVADWRITSPPTWTGDEVAILLTDLFHLRGLDTKSVRGVVIGSVVTSLPLAAPTTTRPGPCARWCISTSTSNRSSSGPG